MPLFIKGKQAFAFNFWQLRPKGALASKKGRASSRKRKGTQSEYNLQDINIENLSKMATLSTGLKGLLTHAGERPKLKAVGVMTNSHETNLRVHNGNIRSSLLLYIELLQYLGKESILQDMEATLTEDGSDFNRTEFADICLISKGHNLVSKMACANKIYASNMLRKDIADINWLSDDPKADVILSKFENLDEFAVKSLHFLHQTFYKSFAAPKNEFRKHIALPLANFMIWDADKTNSSERGSHATTLIMEKRKYVLEGYSKIYLLRLLADDQLVLFEEEFDFLRKKIYPENKDDMIIHRYGEFACSLLTNTYDKMVKLMSPRSSDCLEKIKSLTPRLVVLVKISRHMARHHPVFDDERNIRNCVLHKVVRNNENLVQRVMQTKKRIESKDLNAEISLEEALASLDILPKKSRQAVDEIPDVETAKAHDAQVRREVSASAMLENQTSTEVPPMSCSTAQEIGDEVKLTKNSSAINADEQQQGELSSALSREHTPKAKNVASLAIAAAFAHAKR